MRLRQIWLKGGESISGSKSSEADSEISAPLVQAIVAAAHRWLERHTAECHTDGVSGTPLNRSVLTYFVMLCFGPGSSWKIKPRHRLTLTDDATAWFNKKFGAHPGKSENAIILKVRSYQMHKRINAARLSQTCCSCIVSNSSMRYTAERSSRSTATRRTAMAALSLRTN